MGLPLACVTSGSKTDEWVTSYKNVQVSMMLQRSSMVEVVLLPILILRKRTRRTPTLTAVPLDPMELNTGLVSWVRDSVS